MDIAYNLFITLQLFCTISAEFLQNADLPDYVLHFRDKRESFVEFTLEKCT